MNVIKSPSQIRSRILSEVTRLLERMAVQVSCWHPDEVHVMTVLKERRADVAVAVTNTMMAQFGHETTAAVSRFDKTRRALNAKMPKPPRGENTGLTKAQRESRRVGNHSLGCVCGICRDKARYAARIAQPASQKHEQSGTKI